MVMRGEQSATSVTVDDLYVLIGRLYVEAAVLRATLLRAQASMAEMEAEIVTVKQVDHQSADRPEVAERGSAEGAM